MAIVAVVDDDGAIREALGSLLRSYGYRVAAFASAEEFLQSGSVREAHCLILDLQMPGMTGLELQRGLARVNLCIPTLVLTAYGGEEARARTLAAGAIAFLSKPVDEGTLLDALHLALRDARAPEEDRT